MIKQGPPFWFLSYLVLRRRRNSFWKYFVLVSQICAVKPFIWVHLRGAVKFTAHSKIIILDCFDKAGSSFLVFIIPSLKKTKKFILEVLCLSVTKLSLCGKILPHTKIVICGQTKKNEYSTTGAKVA